MAFSLSDIQVKMGDAVYFDPRWHMVVETHLPILRSESIATTMDIAPHDGYKYEGDLWGLLQAYNQPSSYWYIIMRTNGMYAPTDYRQNQLALLIPSPQTIESFRQIYQTISAKMN